LVNRPITEQLELWASIDVDVWQCAHVKTIQLPEKLSSLRQKLYLKAKQEVMAPFVGVLRVPSGEVQGKAGCVEIRLSGCVSSKGWYVQQEPVLPG
jgi:hypothetical protein